MADEQTDRARIAPQIKSRERVRTRGEVFTAPREVNAMLDLVGHEAERIDSRFLEPACGDGNFLAEILRRKLRVCRGFVERGKSTQLEYEKNAVLAVSGIYGIELLPDNAAQCRERLFGIFSADYRALYGDRVKAECFASIRYLLSRNVIIGDALDYHRVDKPDEWIVLSEWSPLGGGMMNRRDYDFRYMVGDGPADDLFTDLPIRTFAPVHFLNLNPQAYGE